MIVEYFIVNNIAAAGIIMILLFFKGRDE